MVAAGIQHETRAQHIRIAAFLLHHQFGEIAMVVEGFHRVLPRMLSWDIPSDLPVRHVHFTHI